MGKDDFMKFSVSLKTLFVLFLLAGIAASPLRVFAADLPLATSSPMVGVPFDDRPLALPVQRNFQMAMLTASSELGRSCGHMEAYGWRMSQAEQQRVNQIFSTTVDHLRSMGYSVEAQAPTSVSRDITMFAADRADRHFIFMWSAGELGLVMVACEATQPYRYNNPASNKPSVQVYPQDVLQSPLDAPKSKIHGGSFGNFSPVGDWVGGYTCEQGFTGGTLQIAHLKGENFDGYFRFYPTPKNPYVPTGRYAVYGQYDRASQRILINPGKWLERPKDYYNTIMVGNFDPIARTFSAYFQGINGCTSFEAKAASEDYVDTSMKTKKVKKKHKKKVEKKAVTNASLSNSVTPAPTTPAAAIATPLPVPGVPSGDIPASMAPATTPSAPISGAIPAPVSPSPSSMPDAGIVLPAPPAASGTATNGPVSITPPAITPPPSAGQIKPSQIVDPAPATTQAPAAAPIQAPAPAPTSGPATKPQGILEPRHSPKLIQLAASGQWFTPTSPQAQQPTYVTPATPFVPQAQIAPVAQIAPSVAIVNPVAPQAQTATYAPAATYYDSDPPQVQPAQIAPPAQIVPGAVNFVPTVQQAPPAEMVPDYRPSNPGLQGPPGG